MRLKWIRFIVAFMAGTACYVIGFYVGGIFMDISKSIILWLPPAIDLDASSLTASAIAANIFGYSVFRAINDSDSMSIVFSVWLLVMAGVYAVLCLITNDLHLLTYPFVCFVMDGIILYQNISKIKQDGEDKKAEIEKLKNELREKDFEQKFPKALELKAQINEFKKNQKVMDENELRMRKIITGVRKESIVQLYRDGKITQEEFEKTINDYETCEQFIYNAPQVRAVTKKMISDLENQIKEMRNEYEKQVTP